MFYEISVSFRKLRDDKKSFSFSFILSQNSAYDVAVLQISMPKIESVEDIFFIFFVGIDDCLLSNGDINPPLLAFRATIYAITW